MLSWSRPSRAEDRIESWLVQRHQERVLAGETTPVGPCPDEVFLRDLARKAKRIDLLDPRVDHAANCSTCMSRLLVFRQENRSRWRRRTLVTAVVLCSVIGAVVITVARYGMHRQLPSANVAVVSEAVNLWDAGTIRGNQPGPLQSVFFCRLQWLGLRSSFRASPPRPIRRGRYAGSEWKWRRGPEKRASNDRW